MKKKLSYIFIETLIVSIGLLIALQLDNWKERINNRELEKKFLKEIRTTLNLDLKELSYNHERHKLALAYCDSLAKVFKRQYYDSMTGFYIDRILREYIFVPNTSSFESLKGLGLNLITNDSLRIKLTKLYSFDYTLLTKAEEQYLPGKYFDKYYNEIVKNFKNWTPKYSQDKTTVTFIQSTPKDFELLQNDSELQILINLAQRQHIVVGQTYESTIRSVNELFTEIDKELKD